MLPLLLSTFGLVFAVIDPFGYVPVFLAMTAGDSEARRQAMVRRACLVAFLVLVGFTFLGSWVLRFFDISIPALQISGGLILLAIGFEMLNIIPVGKLSHTEQREATEKEDISIVPLAIPMLSGPAAIATVVVLASKTPSPAGYAALIGSIAVTLGVTYWVLRSAGRILGLIGVTGLNAITRVMGLLMCAMAVQFMINGWLAVPARALG